MTSSWCTVAASQAQGKDLGGNHVCFAAGRAPPINITVGRAENHVIIVFFFFELVWPQKMAFVLRRCLSTSARVYSRQGTRKFIAAIPAPVNNVAALETPELQQLARKAQGSWKELSNEETVQRKWRYRFKCLIALYFVDVSTCCDFLNNAHLPAVYRAQFPLTFREMEDDRKSDRKTVIPSVILLTAFSVWASMYLRDTSKCC